MRGLMAIRRLRSSAAAYLLAFCAASLAAPHHHLNPLSDLVTDGASDSGRILIVRAPSWRGSGIAWTTGAIVDDTACLACFWHDVTAATAAIFALTFVFLALAFVAAAPTPRPVFPLLASALSRGPPPASR